MAFHKYQCVLLNAVVPFHTKRILTIDQFRKYYIISFALKRGCIIDFLFLFLLFGEQKSNTFCSKA